MDWKTILVNAGISLLLSFIMFALGVRSAKEQSERNKLREKYRGLTNYFKKYLVGIESNEPNGYFYREELYKRKNNDFLSPFKLKEENQHLELNSKLIKKLIDLEKELFKYQHQCELLKEEVQIMLLQSFMKSKVVFIKTAQNSFSYGKSDQKYPCYSIQLNRLDLALDCKCFLSMVNKYKDTDKNYYISFRVTHMNDFYSGKSSYTIYQNSIKNLDMNAIDQYLQNKVDSNIDRNSVLETKNSIIKKTTKYIKRLENKTKDPYSFWSTIISTLKDFI
jgi:hypothetical protein